MGGAVERGGWRVRVGCVRRWTVRCSFHYFFVSSGEKLNVFVGDRAMPDRRRVDEPPEGVSEQGRQELPGVVSGPVDLESVHRAAVAARGRLTLWVRRDLWERDVSCWERS